MLSRGRAICGCVRLLEVACGSSKFPTALMAAGLPRYGGRSHGGGRSAPCAFSIAEARAVLTAPFEAAAEHEARCRTSTGKLVTTPGGPFTRCTRCLRPSSPAGWPGWSPRVGPAASPLSLSSRTSHYPAFYDA